MYGIIYKATNKINGKSYIGKTVRPLKIRIQRHFNDAKVLNKTYFQRAINKYGELSFEFSIIDTANNKEELNEKETYWIKHYNTLFNKPNSNGYNMTVGGDGASGIDHPSYGVLVSDETRIKIRNTLKNKYEGKDSNLSRPVLQFSIDGEFVNKFYGVSEAHRHLKLKTGGHIGDACNNKLHSAHGFIWIYEEDYSKENLEMKLSSYLESKKAHNRRNILQFDLKGNLKTEHSSIDEATKCINIPTGGNISKCCAREIWQAYGYIWMYKEDFSEEYLKLRLSKIRIKSVVQLTIDNTFVREHPSMTQGATFVNGNKNGVWECCKGKKESYRNFKWMYSDEYEEIIQRGK